MLKKHPSGDEKSRHSQRLNLLYDQHHTTFYFFFSVFSHVFKVT